jgi:hypothetical protein
MSIKFEQLKWKLNHIGFLEHVICGVYDFSEDPKPNFDIPLYAVIENKKRGDLVIHGFIVLQDDEVRLIMHSLKHKKHFIAEIPELHYFIRDLTDIPIYDQNLIPYYNTTILPAFRKEIERQLCAN